MIDQITYDRSEKCYKLPDGDGVIVTFPSGVEGKRQAQRYAIQLANAPLHELTSAFVAQHPHMEARAWKAAQLVALNAVAPAFNQFYLATVAGSSEHGDYTLTNDAGLIHCECKDFEAAPYIDGGNFQKHCKHVLAYQFDQQLSAETTAA